MKPLPLDPRDKIAHHVDVIFGHGTSSALASEPELQFEYSRRTGRIKNFSIGSCLAATLRTDGGLALTIHGAKYFLSTSKQFLNNCVIPMQEAEPFISEGRSLFCRHVEWCGPNVHAGSDVAVISKDNRVLAVGIALVDSTLMRDYQKGVAVKVREGLKSRTE